MAFPEGARILGDCRVAHRANHFPGEHHEYHPLHTLNPMLFFLVVNMVNTVNTISGNTSRLNYCENM